MRNTISTLLLLHLVFWGFSQDLAFDIRGTYEKPITIEKLQRAKTIADINPGYPSSWISNYISVEISATNKGEVRKATGVDAQLTDAQLSLIKMADIGTDIIVNVQYYPKDLLNNEAIKKINFAYTLVPKTEAKYLGGHQLLKQYLKEKAIDKIPENIAKELQIAIVSFSISKEGQITDAQISKTSGDEGVDQLLLEVIRTMPRWKPAEGANGIKIKQKFEFSVGNLLGC